MHETDYLEKKLLQDLNFNTCFSYDHGMQGNIYSTIVTTKHDSFN